MALLVAQVVLKELEDRVVVMVLPGQVVGEGHYLEIHCLHRTAVAPMVLMVRTEAQQ